MKLKRKPNKRDYISIAGMLIFIAITSYLAWQFYLVFDEISGGGFMETAERFCEVIEGYGKSGFAMLIFIHGFQVVFAALPAPVAQFAGAMIYGVFWGVIAGVVGVLAGSVVSFYISRYMGRNIVTLFVSPENLDKIEQVLTKNVSSVLLLALFILPTPKDFLSYFVGMTKYPALKFFTISVIGRLPGMFITSYFGYRVFTSSNIMLIIGLVLCGIFFLVLYIFRSQIIEWIKKRENH